MSFSAIRTVIVLAFIAVAAAAAVALSGLHTSHSTAAEQGTVTAPTMHTDGLIWG